MGGIEIAIFFYVTMGALIVSTARGVFSLCYKKTKKGPQIIIVSLVACILLWPLALMSKHINL